MTIFFFSFIPIRYHTLVVCLLPITVKNRLKKTSLSLSYNHDQVIECLKRAGIDNYKVSLTRLFLSLRSVLFEEKEREKKNDL
jgi:hypothetical protein